MTCVFLLASACRPGDAGRIDAAELSHGTTGPTLRLTIIARPDDPRLAPVREAVAYWNTEFDHLGRRVRLDSGAVRNSPIGDDLLRGASGEVLFGRGPATSRLRAALGGVPGDIVIVLSDADLISFGIPWGAASQGVVAVRRADVPPLTLPNTVRNVVAHEMGHALGLSHNRDAATLMCGRPAPCRPATFASDSAHFFPLTPAEEQQIRDRWP